MTIPLNRDIHALVSVRRAAPIVSIVAGAASDNAVVPGVIIDRSTMAWPKSMIVAIGYNATMAATQTLSIAWTLEHGDDPALADTSVFERGAAAVVQTGTGGGMSEAGILIEGAKRYVRLNYTPDLSRANTDTADLSCVAVFSGADRLPQ